MEHTQTHNARQECRDCGAHTYRDQCGCCRSPRLLPVDVRQRNPRASIIAQLLTKPALKPFTSWQP